MKKRLLQTYVALYKLNFSRVYLQQESVGQLRKARSLYVQRQQEYEKAKDIAQRAESESLAQSSSGNKADKKRKLEEDAMHRVRWFECLESVSQFAVNSNRL